jgi:predicted AAA+ superfamily ATPase
MLHRPVHLAEVRRLLRDNPVVALVGARQVGKTTLARELSRSWRGPTDHFDLEDPRDVARLADPMLALSAASGLVVLDEVQFRPDLFPVLRVLADRARPARFLVLGSASGELLQQGSESLAGRIAWKELPPLGLDEVGPDQGPRLWLRGGFPRSFTARNGPASAQWRRDFIRTFLERDLSRLGVGVQPAAMGRFWNMLAHWHGQTMNWSELGRAMGTADHTIRRYVNLLEATFMVRQLRPWHENLGKRQVKAPKVYLRDSGLLHSLLELVDLRHLERHPKVGASWEGFCIDAVARQLRARPEECHFWATHGGAELDLLVVRGQQRRAFEVKRTSAPQITPSMRTALADLRLKTLDVIHAGDRTFPLSRQIRAVSWRRIAEDIRTFRP